MRTILTSLFFVLIISSLTGQNHLHVVNNTGGEIAKLESITGFPKLVFANDQGNVAQVGLSTATNGNVDDNIMINTLKPTSKIRFQVGVNPTGTGLVTINPNNASDGTFTGAYVGINTQSPSGPLTVMNIAGGVTGEFRGGPGVEQTFVQFTGNSGSTQKGFMGFTGSNLNDYRVGTYAANSTGRLVFEVQEQERMWIESNIVNICGNLQTSGSITAFQVGICSDRRYKKQVKPLTNSLDKVQAINGVSYYWDTENYSHKNFGDEKQIGLIAQEVEQILPELVTTDESGYKTVDYVSLTAVLVEAIKEQQETIESLEEKINVVIDLNAKLMSVAEKE